MSAEDVARALMAMDDSRLRSRVAGGDLAAVGAEGLPDEEQELLRTAAAAVPDAEGDEVGGFASFAPPYVPVGPVVGGSPLRKAMHYATDGIRDPGLASQFHQWSVNVTAQGDW